MSSVKILRKWRARLWRWQIILGDIIALLAGKFVGRYFRKKLLKASGKTAKKLTKG